MTQEIVSVSRATATTALRSLVSDLRTLANGSAIDRPNAAVADLKHSLDTPLSPAGGEVQLPRPVMKLEAEKLLGRDGEYAVSFERPGWLQQCREKGGTYPLYPGDEVQQIFTRLQAENAALQQRLNEADQRVDDLQHERSQILEVNQHSLRAVLTALVGAPHEIRELQACRGLPDNAIDQLLREYNAWIDTPAPADSPQ